MLTIGNLAMRQARAQFSCNFLACAGYKVIDNLGFPTVEEGVEAAMKQVPTSWCFALAMTNTPNMPSRFQSRGRPCHVCRGRCSGLHGDLKAAGIENFIHVRVDQLQTLKEYNAKLGIK